MYFFVLTLHILAATIWTGGHIVLSTVILPKILENEDIDGLLSFESSYEKIGLPAMLIQVVTGIWLTFNLLPEISMWFDFNNNQAQMILIKLALLLTTLGFALDARLRLIPNLSKSKLNSLKWHIIPVTVISVLFVFAGVSLRTGYSF
ncbi:MAG: CopD family protein [Kangiellaceae bacterium]|nr:CopD family protein [Kangiellaceae bacterium]MCW8999825.1 CopD family protein [Kangiellaceae bacterium]MCW9018174.1 CopD family protein [Kangiellaceae bacterium]